jgi:3-hydroxyisobutyrate dehydrogenase
MIAWLGTGLLGAGFSRALRRHGEEVCAWNRTAAKARALEADGVVVRADPAAAVRGATRVHLTLSDDAAVDDVLAKAEPELTAGTLVLDHTTTTAEGARKRTAIFRSRGILYVHAPVFMGPQNALEGTGLMLVSGERPLVERVKPLLAPMTGKVVDLGTRPDAAAAFKLLGNCFLMFMTAGLADMFTLAKALDVPPADAAALFDHFNPGATIGGRAKRMLEAEFANPSWELAMARKDARLMLEEAQRGGAPLQIVPAIAARMDALIAEGHGGDDWTVLGRDALTKRT